MTTRLLQVFLSPHGSYEVSVDTEAKDHFTCNCPGFSLRDTCKHVDYVRSRYKGGYEVNFPDHTRMPTPEEVADPGAWREFMLTHAPVVVLPRKGPEDDDEGAEEDTDAQG